MLLSLYFSQSLTLTFQMFEDCFLKEKVHSKIKRRSAHSWYKIIATNILSCVIYERIISNQTGNCLLGFPILQKK